MTWSNQLSAEPALARVRKLISESNYPEAARECLDFLRGQPAHVEANMLYGELAVLMQRPHDAIIIYRKLLSAAPTHPVAHDRLAYLYNQTGDIANAVKHAEVALRHDSGAIESRLALGASALLDGDKEKALAIFDEARGLVEDDLDVEKAYMDALLQVGEFDKAAQLIHELLARYPDNAPLYNSLSRTRKFREGDPDIEVIRGLVDERGAFRNKHWQESEQVPALMALHKVESDLGNHETAFNYLRRAMDIRRQEAPYEHQRVALAHEQQQALFNADFFSHHTARGLGSTATDPIFIICMPRSGSTLLERVLGGSPQVSAAGELPLAHRLTQELCAKFGDNQHDLAGLRKVPDEVWAQAGDEYVRRARSRIDGAPFFTDKMPGNFMLLGCIRAMLPRAKIIHLCRHPVANCLSIYETDFASGHDFSYDLEGLGNYYVAYRQSMDYWRGLFGQDIIEVRYEDLVSDTAETVATLGQRLQLDLDVGAIEASQQSGNILTASQWQARQPIHTRSVERWKLLEDQLEPLLRALAPVWRPED
jgi:tetratricopeptide (TPR) repeat protein